MGAKGAAEIIFRSDINDQTKTAEGTKKRECELVAAEWNYGDGVMMTPVRPQAPIASGASDTARQDAQEPWKKRHNIPP